MLDRFEEFTNIPQGMDTFLTQGILKADQPRENEDEFSEIKSFVDETGYLHQDLKMPMCGCCDSNS